MVALFMGLCDAAGMLPAEKAPPRRTMRVVKDNSGRTRQETDPSGSERSARGSESGSREKPDPPAPPATTGRAALKTRYIEVLIEKAAASDDDKLLDRIEALLREDEQKD